MNDKNLLLFILLTALVSYLPRMIPLAIFRKRIQNKYIQSFLSYMPYAVLGAMTFPEILYSTNSMVSAIAGLTVALLLSYKELGLLPTALGATGTVFVTEQILHWIAK